MELQRLCYTRLGRVEKNAGYQLAARSEAVDDEIANFFGTKVSHVESIGGNVAEGVFFSEEAAYLARLVMSMDEIGRTAMLSSALVLDGSEWRELHRDYPSWRLALEPRAFFHTTPEGAYPGHPAIVPPYVLPINAAQQPELPSLLSRLGCEQKSEFGALSGEAFRTLLHAVYTCLFTTANEPLFIILPAWMDYAAAARNLMAAIYASMPSSFSSQLSYCCGARFSTQIVFGDRSECKSFANYIDLIPALENKGAPIVNCIQVAGTEYLLDMITACTEIDGPKILSKMESFLEELRLFEGKRIAPVQRLRGKLQYVLNAAWLYASGIAEQNRQAYSYFRPGSDTAARTMLTLAAHLKSGVKYPAVESVLASLLGIYAAWPLHERPSEHGKKLQKEAVERELNNARAVLYEWNSPFDGAYARYLAGSPTTPEGKQQLRANADRLLESGNPRDIHLLSRLLYCGDAVDTYSADDWLRLRACFMTCYQQKQPDAQQAAAELNAALHKAFRELTDKQREHLVREMLKRNSELSLAVEFLKQQSETLCCLTGETTANELIGVFSYVKQYPEYVKMLFLQPDGVVSRQPQDIRKQLFRELFTSGVCTSELLLALLELESFSSLPDTSLVELLCSWIEKIETWNDFTEILARQRIEQLQDNAYTKLLGAGLSNTRLACVFTGGAEQLLNQERTASLPVQNRAWLLENYIRNCPVKYGQKALKTQAAIGMDAKSHQKLAEILVIRADVQQVLELLKDESLYAQLSEEQKCSLLELGMKRAPTLHNELVSLPLIAELCPKSRLKLLEEYPEEVVIRRVLSDLETQDALLNGTLSLGKNTLALCDNIYVHGTEQDSIRQFYVRYLYEQRFRPDSPNAKKELAALANNNRAVPKAFFKNLLGKKVPGADWIGLADWYMCNYSLPAVTNDLGSMLGDLKNLRSWCLIKSAEAYEKKILAALIKQLNLVPDREAFLRRADEMCGASMDLTALRDEFWTLFQLEDMDLSHASFYEREKPKEPSSSIIHEAVSAASSAYCSLKGGGAPGFKGGRELYSLATEGKTRNCSDTHGELNEEQRKELLEELIYLTKPMLKTAPEKLASSPDLSVLALFRNKKELKRADVDRMMSWARRSDVALSESKTARPLLINSDKIERYYRKALHHTVDRRIIRRGIVAAGLTGVIVLGAIFIPPEVGSYSRWRSNYREGSFVEWAKDEWNEKQYKLQDDLASALDEGFNSGIYNFSGKDIDDTELYHLVFRILSSTSTPATELDLSDTLLGDISPISKLTSLTVLDLHGTAVSDLRPISRLYSLEDLDISNTPIHDPSPLSELMVKTLNLRKTQMEDLNPLSKLDSLETLDLSGNALLSDLQPLVSLSNLKELHVEDCTALSDIDAISGKTSLEQLYVGGSSITTCSMYIFADMNSDCALYGSDDTKITPVHASNGRMYQPGDAVLNLSGKTVADLSFLQSSPELFSGLRVLDLSCTDLDDTQLEYIKSVGENLQILILYGNPELHDEAISELRKALNGVEEAADDLQINPQERVLVLGDAMPKTYIEEAADTGEESFGTAISTVLNCSGMEDIDLAALAKKYPHLRALDLSSCNLSSLAGIEEFKELEWLNLSHNNLTSLRELHRMPLSYLKWLDISFNPDLTTIEHLKNYSTLHVLYATDLNTESDMLSVTNDKADFQNLVFLSASNRFNMDQLDEFFPALKVLELLPSWNSELYLVAADTINAESCLPSLVNRGCLIKVCSYKESEESILPALEEDGEPIQAEEDALTPK